MKQLFKALFDAGGGIKQSGRWLLALVAMVASVNLMATGVTFNFEELATNISGTVDGIGWGTGKTGSASATVCNSTNGLVLYGVSGGGGYFNTTSATSGKITSVTYF